MFKPDRGISGLFGGSSGLTIFRQYPNKDKVVILELSKTAHFLSLLCSSQSLIIQNPHNIGTFSQSKFGEAGREEEKLNLNSLPPFRQFCRES